MSARIFPPAPPGSLFKQPRPAKKKKHDMGRKPREHNNDHLECIRQLQCLSCGLDNGCEAAHVRISRGPDTGGGMGLKPHDRLVNPLCTGCHRQQHAMSEEQFWNDIGIDPFLSAAKLYAASGNIEVMRAIVALFLASKIVDGG